MPLFQCLQRCAACIQRSSGTCKRTKHLSERMLASCGRGKEARSEWRQLCLAVTFFNLGTTVEGEEGLQDGLIRLAPGVTLDSLLQFQIPEECPSSHHDSCSSSGLDHGENGISDISALLSQDAVCPGTMFVRGVSPPPNPNPASCWRA